MMMMMIIRKNNEGVHMRKEVVKKKGIGLGMLYHLRVEFDRYINVSADYGVYCSSKAVTLWRSKQMNNRKKKKSGKTFWPERSDQ